MTAFEIEFHDSPPPKGSASRSGGRVAAFVDVLKQNPGRWARYPATATTNQALGGTRAYLKNRYGMEVTQRTEDGKAVLWVRCPGDAA